MKNNFVILVTAPPSKSQSHLTAIRFIRSLLAREELVSCIFFYQDATLVANQLNQPPSDEVQVLAEWEKLTNDSQIELLTCVAASYRRGVIDANESNNASVAEHNLSESFTIAGLGQLSSALVKDHAKLVHFK